MTYTKKFYEEENSKIVEGYEEGLERIKEICLETENCVELKELYKFFNHAGKLILKLAELERTLDEEYFKLKSFDELKNENYELYKELIGNNYNTSYANPKYAVEVLGEGVGQLLSAFYVRIREGISYAFKNRIFSLEENNQIFIEVFNSIKANGVDYNVLKNVIIKPFLDRESLIRDRRYLNEEFLNLNFTFYTDTVLNADLTDLRYLFRLDKYICENEIRMAEFLIKYPMDKIETLSKSVVEAFLRGFIVENKDRGNRNVVKLIYSVGQEVIIKQLITEFKSKGFECGFRLVESTSPNKQYDYDHRFDNSLYLDEMYTKLKEETYDIAFNLTEHYYSMSCGPMVFESFGEKAFSPENKRECLKLSEKQEELIRTHENNLSQIYYKYEPNDKTSFCIIAFPNPEVGEKFEDIFEDTLKINMMDNKHHEIIQQKIIDILDKGEYVHVVGKNGNQTDIKVKLPEIKDPQSQTNFVNCVADVNIPLGEVFTSPELKGTNGILHLQDVFLGLKYKDLKLTFKDGYVADYTCSNFDNEKENREYVKENLMECHKELPLGEFAIGTNTEAYVMAQKYGIIEVLPILIVEKMGPHFAIGDTCFSWSEDLPVYNVLDKKEIVARDNEKSILRKEDINKAYTGVHTDITIPYEEIGFISVITKAGNKIDIIRDGRFVLEGTEELNEPLDR
jgi:aminopeptidase